ncbi:MerR family transcriptional regulator [Solihabitans fulvus]|uniref:MerR family transcriptional regulator n=1 Tax=Solihabitans fulvus TaxID=1892852 RepID=A0A5B2WKS7_9PSEU|nr:MerR family transcriptional regulator [Solihabitans fulvus]KAA2252411.1 MerR family transcriptional regulator [Solihabitans fulvus]
MKIKTLVDAAVPLARIKELLAADLDVFTATIAEIDRGLRKRAAEISSARARLAALAAGDRLLVSAEVATYLDRLRQLGVSRRGVNMERDGWILLQSTSPRAAAIWIADKRDALDDPEFRAIYLEYDAAFDWSPQDPRLPALAKRAERWKAGQRSGPDDLGPAIDPALAQIVAAAVTASSPAWDRLAEIAMASTSQARHDAYPAQPGARTEGD